MLFAVCSLFFFLRSCFFVVCCLLLSPLSLSFWLWLLLLLLLVVVGCLLFVFCCVLIVCLLFLVDCWRLGVVLFPKGVGGLVTNEVFLLFGKLHLNGSSPGLGRLVLVMYRKGFPLYSK